MTQSMFSFVRFTLQGVTGISESGVSSSVSSIMSKPNNEEQACICFTALYGYSSIRAGVNGVSSSSIESVNFISQFDALSEIYQFASSLWRTIITLLGESHI